MWLGRFLLFFRASMDLVVVVVVVIIIIIIIIIIILCWSISIFFLAHAQKNQHLY